jgi:hypothetical protein
VQRIIRCKLTLKDFQESDWWKSQEWKSDTEDSPYPSDEDGDDEDGMHGAGPAVRDAEPAAEASAPAGPAGAGAAQADGSVRTAFLTAAESKKKAVAGATPKEPWWHTEAGREAHKAQVRLARASAAPVSGDATVPPSNDFAQSGVSGLGGESESDATQPAAPPSPLIVKSSRRSPRRVGVDAAARQRDGNPPVVVAATDAEVLLESQVCFFSTHVVCFFFVVLLICFSLLFSYPPFAFFDFNR